MKIKVKFHELYLTSDNSGEAQKVGEKAIEAMTDLLDACYVEGSTSSWRVCQFCDTEYRIDEPSSPRHHKPNCLVKAAEDALATLRGDTK